MIQEIITLIIVLIAVLITFFYFRKKYKQLKSNQLDCGTCSTSECEGCALTKINEAKRDKK